MSDVWRRAERLPGLVLVVALTACAPPEPAAERSSVAPPGVSSPVTGGEPSSAAPLFVDRAAEWGVDFIHFNGMTGELYFAEHMGGGAALFDFDGDGDLDLFLVQGRLIDPDADLDDATFAWRGAAPPRDRLWRNDSGPDRPRFTDVTEASGIAGDDYGMGVAVGDYDGDGRPDLYVTTWASPNRLLKNLGEGRFRDVTAAAGVGDPAWSLSSAFVDFDGDGWLDLFVATYTDFDRALHKACRTYTGAIDYCGPHAFRPLPDRLYRNRGDGTFEAVGGATGIRSEPGTGLGVVPLDADEDGRPDLYVANDQMPNRMWLNRGEAGFVDGAVLGGTAVNAAGLPEAGMGVAAGDADSDGREDLLVTHLTRETNTLYRNLGEGDFEDSTAASALGQPSWALTGFGVGWLDYDNDGWLDLFVANGAVKHLEPLVRAGDPYPMHQPNQLFRNLGEGRFLDVSPAAGRDVVQSAVSRGVALGDLDNDGDTDLVVCNNAAKAELLINQVGQDAAWVGFSVVDRGGAPALGARVELLGPGERVAVRWVRRAGSYASSSDPRVLFGLGAAVDGAAGLVTARVTWPDAAVERWEGLDSRTYHRLLRGTGRSEGGP